MHTLFVISATCQQAKLIRELLKDRQHHGLWVERAFRQINTSNRLSTNRNWKNKKILYIELSLLIISRELSTPDSENSPLRYAYSHVASEQLLHPNPWPDSSYRRLLSRPPKPSSVNPYEGIHTDTYTHVLIVIISHLIAGALTKSQFPVFTIYAQKTCLGIKPCEKAWCFDRVQGYRLNGYIKKKVTATSRQDCLEMCLGEREFSCR